MAKPTLLLYPGAGSDRDQPSLVAIDHALGSGASVERLDFPYRKQGRRAPDRAPKLMQAIRDDLVAVRSSPWTRHHGWAVDGRSDRIDGRR